MQDVRFERLSKKYLLGQELASLILWIFILLFPYFVFDKFSTLWWLVQWGLFAIFIFFSLIYFPVRYFHTGYCVSNETVFYQTGFFFLKTSVISKKRLVFSAVIKSPVTPLLGFCSLVLQAPGAKMKIPGLPTKKAQILLKKVAPQIE